MKKLLSVAAMALAMAVAFTGCASSGGAKDGGGASIPHPRSYVLDPADSKAEVDLPFNSYGPNYQATIDMWSFLKKDKPQAGDTVQIRGKVTSDIDIPNLVFYLTDSSPAANYWTNLCGDNYILDMKAGVAYDINADVVLDTGCKGGLVITFAYDGSDHGQEAAAKVGAPAHFTFEKVADTTDTAAESGVVAPTGPRTIEIAIQKYAALCTIDTNHPWVNGAQDMSVIANFQTTPEVTGACGDFLPKAGDKLVVTWKGISDTDISKLYCRPVDCSSAANWWKELINPIWGAEDEDGNADTTEMDNQMLLAENIVAGEVFEVSKEYVLESDAVAQLNLCIWYDYDPDNGADAPAMVKLVRE